MAKVRTLLALIFIGVLLSMTLSPTCETTSGGAIATIDYISVMRNVWNDYYYLAVHLKPTKNAKADIEYSVRLLAKGNEVGFGHLTFTQAHINASAPQEVDFDLTEEEADVYSSVPNDELKSVFSVKISGPISVRTDKATHVTGNSATLNGTLQSLGGEKTVTVYFQWGIAGAGGYPRETDGQTMTATGRFSFQLQGLQQKLPYWFTAVAQNGTIAEGVELSFTTTAATSGGGDALQEAAAELTRVQTAIEACMAEANRDLLDAAVTAWDGSNGKVKCIIGQGEVIDASDFLSTTLKATYDIDRNGEVTQGHSAWSGISWDSSTHKWVESP